MICSDTYRSFDCATTTQISTDNSKPSHGGALIVKAMPAIQGSHIRHLHGKASSGRPDNLYPVKAMIYHDEEGKAIAFRLSDNYREWADVFSQERIQPLLGQSQFDHKTDLLPNTTPPFGPLYPCSTSELTAMKTWLDINSMGGNIRKSNSLTSSPILLIPKPDSSLRLCVDDRGPNEITVKDCYPLPRMNKLRERLGKAHIFTKFDLKNGWHHFRLKEGDQLKIVIKTRYSLYEYLIIPFGLYNNLLTFQAMINGVLHNLLDEGLIPYIEDIPIYLENEEEHITLVHKVLRSTTKTSRSQTMGQHQEV